MTTSLPRFTRNLIDRLRRAQFPLHPTRNTGKDEVVFIIGGGETFDTYNDYISWLREFKLRESKQAPSWKSWLTDQLVAHEMRVIRPSMPNTLNARYEEWEIMFEKYLALTPRAPLTLVGHSLGAMFLLKYFSLYPRLSKRVRSVHLVAPEFEQAHSFAVTREELPNDSKFFWYQSSDDTVVPYESSSFRVAREGGLDKNRYRLFEDRGHFLDAEFAEVYEDILARR